MQDAQGYGNAYGMQSIDMSSARRSLCLLAHGARAVLLTITRRTHYRENHVHNAGAKRHTMSKEHKKSLKSSCKAMGRSCKAVTAEAGSITASIPSLGSGGQAKFYMQCFQLGLKLTITDSPWRWMNYHGDKR